MNALADQVAFLRLHLDAPNGPQDKDLANALLTELSILALDDHHCADLDIRWQELGRVWPRYVQVLAGRAKGVACA